MSNDPGPSADDKTRGEKPSTDGPAKKLAGRLGRGDRELESTIDTNSFDQEGFDAQRRAEAAADATYRNDLASRELGIEIVEVSPGRVIGTMTVTAKMINGLNLAHGGYLFLLADTILGFAAQTHGGTVVSAHADMTFIAPANGGDVLSAEAIERARFGRSALYDVSLRTQSGELIGEMRGLVRVMKQSAGSAS